MIDSGSVSNEPVHVTDFYPTLVDIAGGEIPENHVIDGLSLVPILTGESDHLEREYLYWYMPLYDPQWGAVPAAVIRKGKYKLIEFFGDYIDLDQGGKYIPEGRVELFDLEKDIGETTDLSDEYPQITDSMKEKLHKWIREMGEEIPGENPEYEPDNPLGRER
jgi:arylsulfatase A-like enzyme